MANEQDYEVKPKKKSGIGTAGKVITGALLAAVIGVIGYPIVAPQIETILETSQSQEFQEPQTDNGFARIELSDEPIVVQPAFDIGPLTDQLDEQRQELESRNAALADQVKALQGELGQIAENAAAESNGMAQQLADALQRAQTQNAEALAQLEASFQNKIDRAEAEGAEEQARQTAILEDLQKQNAELTALIATRASNAQEAELERLRLEVEAQRQLRLDEAAMAAEAEELRQARQTEERRQAELRTARQEQRALMEARIKSESVVFDAGSSTGPGDTASDAASGQGQQSTADRNRAFVEYGAEETSVTQSKVIANPSNTVLQGTMIQATLENAVESSLPGSVTAMVTYPVYSFDGSKELIPPGSLLFGKYSSDVSLGQARILVGWTRIVTPAGQSVQISAYGGDEQGRSGITGRVNTRFAQRFGGAALISLIGAAPAIAANSASSEVNKETAENIADNFATATGSIINEYASLPPIIAVSQGALVTVMVDRDLEFY